MENKDIQAFERADEVSAQRETIRHSGTVIKIDGEMLKVRLEINESCSACASQSGCGLASAPARLPVIQIRSDRPHTVGEKITVAMKPGSQAKASFFVFVVPFLLIPVGLLAAGAIGMSQVASALMALTLILAWFGVLILLRKRLSPRFVPTLIETDVEPEEGSPTL